MQPRPVWLRYPQLFRDARRLIRRYRLGSTWGRDQKHRLVLLACAEGGGTEPQLRPEWTRQRAATPEDRDLQRRQVPLVEACPDVAGEPVERPPVHPPDQSRPTPARRRRERATSRHSARRVGGGDPRPSFSVVPGAYRRTLADPWPG